MTATLHSPTTTAFRPTPFARLTTIELRKTLDTRSGLCLLLVVAAVSLAGLGYGLAEGQTFADAFRSGMYGPQLLLPVIGVLAMTSEWSRRTALTTFTLVPRRGRVLGAKILAVLVLTTVVMAVVAALAAVVTLLGAPPADPWTDAVPAALGQCAVALAAVVQGIGLGALLQHPAAALVLYFVLPPVWNTASRILLDDAVARWFDVFTVFDALGALDPTVLTPPMLTAVAVWVGIPLAAGIVRGLRRDIS